MKSESLPAPPGPTSSPELTCFLSSPGCDSQVAPVGGAGVVCHFLTLRRPNVTLFSTLPFPMLTLPLQGLDACHRQTSRGASAVVGGASVSSLRSLGEAGAKVRLLILLPHSALPIPLLFFNHPPNYTCPPALVPILTMLLCYPVSLWQ